MNKCLAQSILRSLYFYCMFPGLLISICLKCFGNTPGEPQLLSELETLLQLQLIYNIIREGEADDYSSLVKPLSIRS